MATCLANTGDVLTPNVPPDPTLANRQASFTLNQNLQVEKLVADAVISDCAFTANNSDQNVGIQCSSGFYQNVAKPAFSTLSIGFSHRTGTHHVTCSNIVPSYDYRGVEFNRIFWFSITDSTGTRASVTVHLHHSTRLVQVQGSAVMHDGHVAAVWFVKNLLLDLFLKLGKARGHDIAAFNQAVLSEHFKSSGKKSIPSETCDHCKKPLKKPAKPLKCFACKSVFHTTCHKQHDCQGTPARPPLVTRLKRKAAETSSLDESIFEIIDDSPNTGPPPFPSLLSTSAPVLAIFTPSSVPSFLLTTPTGTASSVSFGTSTRTVFSAHASLPSTIQPITLPSLLPSPALSLPAAPPSPSRQPSPSPPTTASSPVSIPPVFLQTSNAPPLRLSGPPASKKPRNGKAPAVTVEGAQREYLKIQLNLAQTKIASQDNTLKKQEETISFLSERLRLLELGINTQLLSQYFPSNQNPNTSQPTNSSANAPGQSPPDENLSPGNTGPTIPEPGRLPPPPTAPHDPTCSTHCAHLSQLSRKMEILMTEIDILKKQTNTIQTDVVSVKNHQSTSSIPNPPSSYPNSEPSPPTVSDSPWDSSESSSPRGCSSCSCRISAKPATDSSSRSSPNINTKKTTSRQVQTSHHHVLLNQSKPPVRPIRPLFPPPSPWQEGFFPTGPVRQLPPPLPRRVQPPPRLTRRGRSGPSPAATQTHSTDVPPSFLRGQGGPLITELGCSCRPPPTPASQSDPAATQTHSTDVPSTFSRGQGGPLITELGCACRPPPTPASQSHPANRDSLNF